MQIIRCPACAQATELQRRTCLTERPAAPAVRIVRLRVGTTAVATPLSPSALMSARPAIVVVCHLINTGSIAADLPASARVYAPSTAADLP